MLIAEFDKQIRYYSVQKEIIAEVYVFLILNAHDSISFDLQYSYVGWNTCHTESYVSDWGVCVILQKCQVSCMLLLAVGRLDISTFLGSGKFREESTVFMNGNAPWRQDSSVHAVSSSV